MIIVVAGGPGPNAALASRLPAAELVVAADSGLDHARSLGLRPDVLVGDLDSLSPSGLAWAAANGVRIDRHAADKDATDLALALDVAVAHGDHVLVVDGGGGRFDQVLANALLLAAPAYAGAQIWAHLGDAFATVVRGRRRIHGPVGSVVSLLALGGRATGVTTTDLRWPLFGAVLEPGSTQGVSNELVAEVAEVEVAAGVVIALQPDGGRVRD